MIILLIIFKIAEGLMQPYCGCDEEAHVSMAIHYPDASERFNRIEITAGCYAPFRTLRIYDGGGDFWK